jgi:hypothetical protein
MNRPAFRPLQNTSLPHSFRQIRLERARERNRLQITECRLIVDNGMPRIDHGDLAGETARLSTAKPREDGRELPPTTAMVRGENTRSRPNVDVARSHRG